MMCLIGCLLLASWSEVSGQFYRMYGFINHIFFLTSHLLISSDIINENRASNEL